MTHPFERDPHHGFCLRCGYAERDLLMHAVHAEPPPPPHVMSDFERRLADRFREHGDRLLSGQRAWTETLIDVGTEPLLVRFERLPGHGSPRGAYRYELRLDAAGLVRIQDLLGIETIGPYILVDARILAERASDGPVFAVTTLRLWYGKIERGSALMMRSPGGMWIMSRWATVGAAEKACIAAIRKKMRRWIADFEAQGFAPGEMVRDPESTWEHGRDPTYVIFDSFGSALFLCDGVNAGIEVRRAADGKWIASDTGRMGFFEEEYAAGKIEPVVEEPDPDDVYLEGAFA